MSVSGAALEPPRPVLAAAQRDGLVTAEQVGIVVRALAKVDRPGVDPADVAAGERLLVGFAHSFGPSDLRRLAEQTVDAIDPDGTIPDEQYAADRRDVSVRPGRDGMYRGELRLTAALGMKLTAMLQPLAKPRLDALRDGDRQTVEVDDRTFGQRTHDALEELCDRLLRAGDVVGMGGTPATVIVSVTAEDLQDRVGYATGTDGSLLPVRELLQLAAEAEVIPTVLNHSGAVLSLGRTRRIASSNQTLALVARDGGCSFPSCDRGPQWCQRHHIVDWIKGGATDVDNLTLLCRYHHAQFAGRGWTCRLNQHRLPEWTPPTWVDRTQTPILHTRIRAELHHRQQQRRRQPADSPTT